ncbi:MAG: T9SS type A sorting domain-containing protein [Crocinitomicaceae bacterium]|nr:T9SS type A sorting domain-containing protein [Crocinitomicaceae bacterium]MBK8927208.1 T9SS type A sorting domain-containing protein [Crocinitomicaceae bacterium]
MGRGGMLLLMLCAAWSAKGKDILLECGTNTGNGFNGWSIAPYKVFSEVNFSEETVSFYSAAGGDYNITLTRKISALREYAHLYFNLDVKTLQNCAVNGVDIYTSADEKEWTAVKTDQSNYEGEYLNESGHEFVKIVVNVSFKNDGLIECAYLKIEGENDAEMETVELEDSAITDEPFFIFSFNRSINVETKREDEYQVIITNLAGQVVYVETTTGSTRIEPELTDGIYILSVICKNEIAESKKIVLQAN